MKELHHIQIERDEILADKMKIGFIVKDSQDGIFVNITGVTCKHFRALNKAHRWIKRNVSALLPDVRGFLLDRRRGYPQSRFTIA